MSLVLYLDTRKEKRMEEYFIMILVALSFNVLDLITGFISAVYNKKIMSSKLRDGLFKKVGFIICYILGFMVDTEGQLIGLNIGVKILPIIILGSVLTEIASLVENIAKINSKAIPDKIKEIFNLQEDD